MSTILDQLADYARYRVEQAKERKPLEEIREEALNASRKGVLSAGTSAPDFPELLPSRFLPSRNGSSAPRNTSGRSQKRSRYPVFARILPWIRT